MVGSVWAIGPNNAQRSAWPNNLRAVSATARELEGLVRSFQPHPAWKSLHLLVEPYTSDYKIVTYLGSLPTHLDDISVTLSNIRPGPNSDTPTDLRPFFDVVHKVSHLIIQIYSPFHAEAHPLLLLRSLVGILPSAIKRITIATPGCLNLPRLPFDNYDDIYNLFSENKLPSLKRLDFPDFKRRHLEEDLAMTDVIAECERRSIRVVCWEELI